jgi:3-dehydroquinate synthase
LNTYAQILNFLAENELTRTDALVALGGGVVGDITGFASATYLRGVKYIQIPTTLLAQVDSSVGGKTAVDLPSGKNLVGAFCQPKVVICDATALDSLPKTIFTDGMGEVAKYAILDKKVFDLIDNGYDDIVDLIYLCVDYKRQIVEMDEFENGPRKLLNLGHTPAHGIEKLSNYQISHGNAVAMGLKIIIDASKKQNLIDEKTHLSALTIVEKCVGKVENKFALKDLCDAMLFDKKRKGNAISLTMIFNIGDCRSVSVDISDLWGYLS